MIVATCAPLTVEPVDRSARTRSAALLRRDLTDDLPRVELAEVFLHHRVLIIPVTEDKRVVGLVTRSDFFAAVAERFLANSG